MITIINKYQIGAMEPWDTLIDKGALANPYTPNKVHDEEYCSSRYSSWLKLQIQLNNSTVVAELERLKRVHDKYGSLRLIGNINNCNVLREILKGE